MKTRELLGDRVFNGIVYVFLSLVLLSTLYPLYFVVIASISDPNKVAIGKVLFWPVDITFSGYKKIMGYQKLWIGYRNTLFYTFFGTFVNIAFTLSGGFVLSRREFPGRGVIILLITFTMLFSGGLIPRYFLIRNLKMYDTIWAMILPQAIGVWNLMIARTFIEYSIPDEMFDAASIDGCGYIKYFFLIVLPLSSAVTAVLALQYGIYHWNDFFDAIIFLKSDYLQPLQVILRSILISSQSQVDMMGDVQSMLEEMKMAESLKYGVIIVSTLPMMLLYPFLQKYFVKGVMIGSVKG